MEERDLLRLIESVKVMSLKPGDVVVLRLATDASISSETADQLKSYLTPLLPEGQRVIVLSQADIEIIRPERK